MEEEAKPDETGQSVPTPKSFSKTALAAILFAVAGWLLFGYFLWRLMFSPYLLAAGGLGVLAWLVGGSGYRQIKASQGAMAGKGLVLVARVLSFFLVLGSLLLGTGRAEGFRIMTAKSKQTEAKMNLSAIYSAQYGFYSEHDAFAKSFSELAWQPDYNGGKGVYAYFLAADAAQPPDRPVLALPPEIVRKLSAGEYLAVAVGNIDRDATLDVWTIDSQKDLQNLQDDLIE